MKIKNFKVFEDQRRHNDLLPAISINSQYGKFAFNKPASDILKLNGIKSIVLLFDDDTKTMAFRQPVGFDEPEYKLSNSSGQTYLGFSARAYIKYIKYPLKHTRSFPVEWYEKHKMFVAITPDIWNSKQAP
jgi:hypothetical protein